jgi:hypothetical protein
MDKQLLLNTNSGALFFARRTPRKTKSKQSRYVRVWTKLGRVLNIDLSTLGLQNENANDTPARIA